MTLYRVAVLDTPGVPFVVGPGALAHESDAAIVVRGRGDPGGSAPTG